MGCAASKTATPHGAKDAGGLKSHEQEEARKTSLGTVTTADDIALPSIEQIESGRNRNHKTTWRYEPGKALDHYLKRDELAVEKPICKYFDRQSSGFDYFERDEYIELRDTLDEKYGRHLLLQYARETSDASHLLLASWILMHKYHLHQNPSDRYRLGTEILDKLIKPYHYCEQSENESSSSPQGESISPRVPRKLEIPDTELLMEASPLKNTAAAASHDTVKAVTQELLNKEDEDQDKNKENSEPKANLADMLILDDNDAEEKCGLQKMLSELNLDEIPQNVQEWCASNLAVVETELLEFGEREFAPRPNLFLPLQSIIFKDMILLHDHFKRDEKYSKKLQEIKRVVYNTVKPNDFVYYDIIGKGGFGKVVHVMKKSTRKHYAMKIQAKDRLLSTWGSTMENVEIERDVLVANERFPFIISLRYAFQTEQYAFLVLDLAEAGSLSYVLSNSPGNTLEEAQVRLYVAEIVLALECLHDHGIIYRDLKPSNVLLSADGHVTLADMGLAGFYYQKKYYSQSESSSGEDTHRMRRKSSHDTDCGTPLYRPPEMVKSQKYGAEVDWFMLGVLMFETLFGYLPFEPQGGLSDDNVCEIRDKKTELHILTRRKLEIPEYANEQTAKFISSLLELDPKKRLGGGDAADGLDRAALKAHPFFFPLEGPLAKSIDWDKVLNKKYEPVVLPKPVLMQRAKKKFSSFEAVLKHCKKRARQRQCQKQMECRKDGDACDVKKKGVRDIETVNEGQSFTQTLQHYFDNWNYVCPEAIKEELLCERKANERSSRFLLASSVLGNSLGG